LRQGGILYTKKQGQKGPNSTDRDEAGTRKKGRQKVWRANAGRKGGATLKTGGKRKKEQHTIRETQKHN